MSVLCVFGECLELEKGVDFFLFWGYTAGSVDFGRAVVESRTFVSELLRERESDVLVRVPFRDPAASKEITICVLVEHQSSVDAVMAVRILTYMVEIWHRELRAWNSMEPEQR